MLFSQITALFASAAIVSAKPFFGLERRDQPSQTSAQGYVGRATTFSNTNLNGYISSSTFWIGSSCKGTQCKTTTTQMYAKSTCTQCVHYITSGVTTDTDGDDVTYTGDIVVTTDRKGRPVTSSHVTTLPKETTAAPTSEVVSSSETFPPSFTNPIISSAWSNSTFASTKKSPVVTVILTTAWPTLEHELIKTVTVTAPWPTEGQMKTVTVTAPWPTEK